MYRYILVLLHFIPPVYSNFMLKSCRWNFKDRNLYYLYLERIRSFIFSSYTIRPQPARHVVPVDCFITTSISKELVPEIVPHMVLLHQIPNFRIKHGKFPRETIHIPSLHPSLSFPIENIH